MKIVIAMIALLLIACASVDNIEKAVMDKFKSCKNGSSVELTKQNRVGVVKTKVTQTLFFSGWQDDTCTMKGFLNSCNYTKSEAETMNYTEFGQLIDSRCFD